MTVSSETNKTQYTGSGSTGPFTIGFDILADTHLKVVRSIIATGVETELTLNAGTDGYTIDTDLTEITTTEAVAATERLTILRNAPYTQLIDYLANNTFPSETNEQGLDQLTMIAQQLKEESDRNIKLPVSSVSITAEVPAPTALGYWRWDAAGTAIEYVTIAGLGTVTLPASTTDNSLIKADGTDGETYQSTDIIVSDTNSISGIENITLTGTVDGRDVATDGTKLDTIETSATADQTDAEIETAYNNQVGVVSQAAAEAGTSTTPERWTPERVKQAINALASVGVFTESYTSSEQTITSAGSLTLAHSLSGAPKMVQMIAICKTTEGNYSVNDEVVWFNNQTSASVNSKGCSLVLDATNINVRFGSDGNPLMLQNKTTGTTFGATNANWKIIFKAFY